MAYDTPYIEKIPTKYIDTTSLFLLCKVKFKQHVNGSSVIVDWARSIVWKNLYLLLPPSINPLYVLAEVIVDGICYNSIKSNLR